MNKPALLHPILREKLKALILVMRGHGYDVDVFQGYRDLKEQHKLFLIGRFGDKRKRVTNADAGQSLHNYGLAGDMVFQVKGNWTWSEKMPWALLGKEGKKLGLEWGGDWKGDLNDRPHFQYTKGLSLAKIKSLYKQGGLFKLWESIK